MAIIEDESDISGKLLDITQLKNLISLYKFPLILAGVGLIFLIVAIGFLVKSQNVSSEVIFSVAESSPSDKVSSKVHVDVEGAVINPGVYILSDGDRITQALAAAGGIAGDADRLWISKNMNLAAKLVDGGKVYIPAATENSAAQVQNSDVKTPASPAGGQNVSDSNNLLGVTTGQVNINTATQSELEALPGVGPVTAGKIISNRPYQTIEELKNKKAVGNALFTKIKDLIVVY